METKVQTKLESFAQCLNEPVMVGELRKVTAGLPDDSPVLIAAEEAGFLGAYVPEEDEGMSPMVVIDYEIGTPNAAQLESSALKR